MMKRRNFIGNVCKAIAVASVVPIVLKKEELKVYYKYPMQNGGTCWMRHYRGFDGPHPPLSMSKIEIVAGERIRIFESETILGWKN